VRQQRPLGLGHAILCARELIGDEPFVLFLPDDLIDAPKPCARQLMDVYERTGRSVVALMDVPREETYQYGIVAGRPVDGQSRELAIDSLVEKPRVAQAPSTLAVVGRYVLDPRVFDYLTQVQPGAGGEIQLTDALAALAASEGLCGWLFEGERFDAGDVAGYLLANLNWARKTPRLWHAVQSFVAARTGEPGR